MGRVMGLDIGKKRIGVALSDPSGVLASPLEVLHWGSGSRELPDEESVLMRLGELVSDYEVDILVVGIPKSMGGGEGPQAEYTRHWVGRLRDYLQVRIVTWDERLSTVGAERALLEGNVRRRSRRGLVDKMAAALILETYLRSRSSRCERERGEDEESW